METKNESGEVEESLDLPEVKEGEEDTTNWKEEAQKLRDKAISQRERTKALKQELKDAKKAVELIKKPEPTPTKTGELDETALDYLDIKGISEAEDIKVIEDIVKKTGMTVRQVLKDEYVQTKLTANKAKREVENATPSSDRRGGGGNQSDDLASAIAKFEATGKLPEDFALKSKVINATVAKSDSNKPSWH